MQRKRRKKKRFGVFLFLLVVCIGIGIMFVPWAMQPENFREVKNKINGFLYKEDFPDSYNAKSLILVDCSDDEIFVSKNENEPQIPASLAKLFVIEYASTLADLDSIVVADYGAISLTKPGSSVAQIKEKEYFLHNLFAAMLVPSGNDAAYVVADYCGGLLSPQAESCQERVRIFMENLNLHLQQQGYLDTVLYDPSGFDMEALTTTLDLKEVVYRLLEYSWFREIVSQNTYTATLPDGSTQIWQNTNAFLDPTSEYYNENVCGIKTGSLSDDYNLIVLYQQHGKEFLICSLGSQSDSSRYDDVNFILKTIDESYYLIISRNKSYVVQDKKTNQVGDNIGRIVIMEFKAQDSTAFDDMLAFVKQHPDFEKLEISYEPTLSLSGLEINLSRRRVINNGQEIELTVKEYDILCLLAANKGRVLTYEQIYDKVWGEISAGNEKDTVGFHIRNLRKKLCDTNSHFSIDSVREIGYRFNSQ